jgi:hypothetical protein
MYLTDIEGLAVYITPACPPVDGVPSCLGHGEVFI